jgi:hypothetical protein
VRGLGGVPQQAQKGKAVKWRLSTILWLSFCPACRFFKPPFLPQLVGKSANSFPTRFLTFSRLTNRNQKATTFLATFLATPPKNKSEKGDVFA